MADDLSGFSMLELFRLEAESQTAVLSAGVLAIEELEKSPETIESMMRAAHSLKGAARIVGLEPAVQVAHALEDVFVAAGKGRPSRPPRARRRAAGGDRLSGLDRHGRRRPRAGSAWADRAGEIVTRLAARCQRRQAAGSASAAGPAEARGGRRPARSGTAAASPTPTRRRRLADGCRPPARAADAQPPAAESSPGRDRVAGRACRPGRAGLGREPHAAGGPGRRGARRNPPDCGPSSMRCCSSASAQVDLCDALAALDEKLEAASALGGGGRPPRWPRSAQRADAGLAGSRGTSRTSRASPAATRTSPTGCITR